MKGNNTVKTFISPSVSALYYVCSVLNCLLSVRDELALRYWCGGSTAQCVGGWGRGCKAPPPRAFKCWVMVQGLINNLE